MAVEPDFFGWDAHRQDRYRRDTPEAVGQALERRLDAGGGDAKRLDWQRLEALNTLKLPLFGIGEDCFYLNEPGNGWYDMETVADLSHDHYRADPEREENKLPFMGQFFPCWVRYLRRGRLVYATLTAFHHHVSDEIAHLHDDLVDELIPSRFVEGANHGKRTKGGYIWDMRRDAGGLEGQLDELVARTWRIQNALYLRALGDCHVRDSGQVFREVKSDGIEAMTRWIFDGIKAMQGVRLTHFLVDVHARRASRRILTERVAPYLDEAECRLLEAHEDIMRNWNPALSRLKRKRRIVLSDQAASDLMDD